jgi:methylthioribose-1-phosphate isomerase
MGNGVGNQKRAGRLTLTSRIPDRTGRIETVRIVPRRSAVANYGFDMTPARLVSGLITNAAYCRAIAKRRRAFSGAVSTGG